MDQLNQNKNQEKVKGILEHETRRAVNADSVKKGSVYGREYYSVSQTQKDNAFIDKVLQGKTLIPNITEEEKNRLLTVQSRNSSHLLVNDYKLMSFDGGKMKSVKENLFLLERALASKEVNEKVIKDVRLYFTTAIMACETYVENKNPWFPEGKRRKRQVVERLKTLREEQKMYEWGLSAVQKGLTTTEPQTNVDIITIGRNCQTEAESKAKEFDEHYESMKSFAITSTKERFGAPNPDEDAEKVQLSDKAQEEFISFFKSKDFYETLKTNEVTDRWGEFAGLKDKNNYLNQSSVLTVNSIYKLIHSTDEEKVAAYAQNKKEIDETYSLFEKEMRTVDMFGFVIPMMQTRKNGVDDPALRKEISDALDVYYALYTKMTIVAGEHENKIKKLMGKE